MKLPIEDIFWPHREQLAFDGDSSFYYGDFRVNLLRCKVTHMGGLKAGDRVAWCPRNDADAILTFWSLLHLGCIACPISHRFPDSMRNEILTRLDAKWLPDLVPTGFDERFGDGGYVSNQPSTIILSSGSTGVPKAIVHTLESHIANAEGAAINMPLGPGDRWLWSLPLFHVSGLSILVRCAVAGATVVGMGEQQKLTAELLDETRVTHLSVVTTQLRRLLAEPNFPSKHLKYVLLGGSAVDPALVEQARQRGVAVLTTYGLTETASQVTTSTPDDDSSKSGRILPNRELKISSSGEILVRGETLCLGYYAAGEIQSVVDNEGWFHTKDLGSLSDDGQLSVRGRIDNMFISGGENIHPESIERAMLCAFDITQVVVVPKPDESFGAIPVAFVNGSLPSDWQSELRKTLQGYEIPVEVFDWPAEADGAIKPNRNQLQELASKRCH